MMMVVEVRALLRAFGELRLPLGKVYLAWPAPQQKTEGDERRVRAVVEEEGEGGRGEF